MKVTKSKTIWSIKSRWLRVPVAWVFAIVAAFVLAALCLAAVAVSAAVGAARNVAEDTRDFFADRDWPVVARAAWAAMTGKDEPQ